MSMFDRIAIIISIFISLLILNTPNSIADEYSNSDFDVYSSQETHKLRGKLQETQEQHTTNMTYESVSKEYNQGIKKLEELNKKISEVEQEIKQNELKLNKAENLLIEARKKNNYKAETIINEAIQKLKEAKKKNIETLSLLQAEREKLIKSLDNLYETLKDLSEKENKILPYFSGDVPPVNCKVILESKDKEKCYCPSPNRPPLCFSSKEEKEAYLKKSQEKKLYNCYWKAETLSGTGGFAITDGNYFGQHSTYEEAIEACRRDAKQSIERGGFKILNFECSCEL